MRMFRVVPVVLLVLMALTSNELAQSAPVHDHQEYYERESCCCCCSDLQNEHETFDWVQAPIVRFKDVGFDLELLCQAEQNKTMTESSKHGVAPKGYVGGYYGPRTDECQPCYSLPDMSSPDVQCSIYYWKSSARNAQRIRLQRFWKCTNCAFGHICIQNARNKQKNFDKVKLNNAWIDLVQAREDLEYHKNNTTKALSAIITVCLLVMIVITLTIVCRKCLRDKKLTNEIDDANCEVKHTNGESKYSQNNEESYRTSVMIKQQNGDEVHLGEGNENLSYQGTPEEAAEFFKSTKYKNELLNFIQDIGDVKSLQLLIITEGGLNGKKKHVEKKHVEK